MADQFIIAATKRNYDVLTETDINNYVFHSAYNTFKIIKSGIYTVTVPGLTSSQVFTTPHLLDFIPLVTGFAQHDGYDQACPPNTSNIYFWGVKAGLFSSGLVFESIGADDTNVRFKLSNTLSGDILCRIKYYCLESI